MEDDGRNRSAYEEMASDAWSTIRKLQMIIILEACVIGVLAGVLLR